jgi:hypothetical protein
MTCDNLPPDSDIPGLDWALGDAFYALSSPDAADPSTPRKIKLTWKVSDYHYPSADGIRVQLTAVDAVLMPTKVFAYMLLQATPGETEKIAAFDHVCSSADLEEFPENAPAANTTPSWFRLDYVDVVLRSRAEVHAFLRDAASDVYALKKTLDLADRLNPVGELWIGGAPTASSSSSSS